MGGPRGVSVGSLLVSYLLWMRDGIRIGEICCASDVIDSALCMYNTDISLDGALPLGDLQGTRYLDSD